MRGTSSYYSMAISRILFIILILHISFLTEDTNWSLDNEIYSLPSDTSLVLFEQNTKTRQ